MTERHTHVKRPARWSEKGYYLCGWCEEEWPCETVAAETHAKALAEALRQVLRSLDTLDGESLSMLGRDALLEHVLGVVHDAGVDVARDELAAYDKDHDR